MRGGFGLADNFALLVNIAPSLDAYLVSAVIRLIFPLLLVLTQSTDRAGGCGAGDGDLLISPASLASEGRVTLAFLKSKLYPPLPLPLAPLPRLLEPRVEPLPRA